MFGVVRQTSKKFCFSFHAIAIHHAFIVSPFACFTGAIKLTLACSKVGFVTKGHTYKMPVKGKGTRKLLESCCSWPY